MHDVEPLKAHPMQADTIKSDFIQNCHKNSKALATSIETALADANDWVEVLIYVDQFEELFTLTPEADRQSFVDLLTHPSDKIRVIITMRADFYPRAVPFLEKQLRTGTFTLDKPDQFALLEMIKRPAERAALEFEDGLPEQIVQDTGNSPGALALMAYALDELYHAGQDKHHLTYTDYEALNGVQGAIGQRAKKVFDSLDKDAQAMLTDVFRELVAVDENGTPTRKRMPYGLLNGFSAAERLVDAFTSARLLVQNQSENGAIVEVAHEALFRHWDKLVDWIDEYKGDLYLLSQLRKTAAEWETKGRSRDFLWLGERGQEVQAMLTQLNPDLDEVEAAFARPEQNHLLDELQDIDVTHVRRDAIDQRLNQLGDTRRGVGVVDGLPDIVWCVVPGGQITIADKNFTVQPFYMAQYLITYEQFQVFLDAPAGFDNDEWWQELHQDGFKQSMNDARQQYANYPRDNVSWYQAVAFTRWLNYQLQGQSFSLINQPDHRFTIGTNLEIRLPTEWEWQHAATGGNPENKYPWGAWDGRYANTSEAGIGRTTAVGMYPAGQAGCGALDISGNLYEWCLNDYTVN